MHARVQYLLINIYNAFTKLEKTYLSPLLYGLDVYLMSNRFPLYFLVP